MTSFIQTYGFLIVLFPLLGAAVSGFLGNRLKARYGEKLVGYTASGAVLLSFVLSLAAFFTVLNSGGNTVVNSVYTWLAVGNLKADVAFLFDQLSAVMLLIITGIGFLIHVYSTGYMKGDPGYARYFAYLNLFVFSMLVLVLAENALLMFVGWEGVGLCSYLLIGFWFHEKANASAANKAFIVNRVGDFGFIVGLFLLFWCLSGAAGPFGQVKSILSFPFLAEHAHLLGGKTLFNVSVVTIICLCLFVGATGKSAQIPLYVWLPDAMAGPTPVSALIHAATMVTAGVYMIGRLHFLFSMSSIALGVIAVIGAATALFAATMGCVQNDIKKVLAYSTVSQLGYMFLGMGVGAFSAGLFHVMTHAFFKACLFLGAGSVILGMHHEQDIRNMGGLRKHMPRTFATFAVATAAIAGIPPFSGFFSKDEILWQAFSSEHGHPVLWFAGFLTAGITAFYMSRLAFLTFFGERRGGTCAHHDTAVEHETHGHRDEHAVHESPAAITVPLLILAFFSLVAGLAGVPEALGGSDRFASYLSPLFGHHGPHNEHNLLEYVLMAASVGAAGAGIGTAYLFYIRRPELPGMLTAKMKYVYALVVNKYYVDEIYGFIFVSGTKTASKALAFFDKYVIDLAVNASGLILRTQARIAGWFDNTFVDGAVNLVADSTLALGENVRKVQTGRVQVYILVLVLVLAAAVGIVLTIFSA
ncbi:MAG TPA: NADH-quinone oxidoreductase subunit L [Nitrospirota bacterium]|nr:NADH-quinone oxidoreductase subunit L [Nitrospirota bacterium]